MLIKPVENYEVSFSISREIIVIFSPYEQFQPRSLDALEEVSKTLQDMRTERICYVLISKDNQIEEALKTCLSNQESQIIVPFFYNEFAANKSNQHFLRNKFRKYFYSKIYLITLIP